MNRYCIRPEESMLLVIDIQQRLFNAMEKDFRDVFVRNSGIMLNVAKAFDMPIVVSEQYPQGLGSTIDEILDIVEDLPRFEKLFFSCMRDRLIREQLSEKSRKTVVVIGIEAHVCVYQTVIDLLMEGYRAVVVSDAVCSRRGHDRSTALSALNEAGALVCSTETLAFMLMQKAGTPIFKKLSLLFR
ncbi:MAG TPA: isochorismatase family protein [Deltaproteobacteria bacterium]|nr:isochorismatase family protein [Deltaproteobacteria bacterium]